MVTLLLPALVLDLWAEWWRKRHARGDMIIVRFADDFITGFEYQEDAERFLVSCAAGSRSSGWNCTRIRRG